MRWFIHGNLTSAVADALKRHGHTIVSADEIQVDPHESVGELLKQINAKQLDLITNDSNVPAVIFHKEAKFDRSIVLLQFDGGDIEHADAVERLFARYKRLSPVRLYTVTQTRVKVRQLPSK